MLTRIIWHPWVCGLVIVGIRNSRRPPTRRGGVGAVLPVFRGQDATTATARTATALVLKLSQWFMVTILRKKATCYLWFKSTH